MTENETQHGKLKTLGVLSEELERTRPCVPGPRPGRHCNGLGPLPRAQDASLRSWRLRRVGIQPPSRVLRHKWPSPARESMS